MELWPCGKSHSEHSLDKVGIAVPILEMRKESQAVTCPKAWGQDSFVLKTLSPGSPVLSDA
jgi:hypothetical protein